MLDGMVYYSNDLPDLAFDALILLLQVPLAGLIQLFLPVLR